MFKSCLIMICKCLFCALLSSEVCIIYHSCGDEIRAHSGRMWCFTSETGSLRPFSGLISDTILMDIQNFLMTLEGLFRCMGSSGVCNVRVLHLFDCHFMLVVGWSIHSYSLSFQVQESCVVITTLCSTSVAFYFQICTVG